ncbi:dihydrodiol dehydrogenase [Oceanobacillus sp. 143]|uniref:Dihydrodiol dehydrogenase n=1 Tax=Oceanobacillus zhaokaii TaxID=2052660 RepID=A0A345PE55_9BACI|nr:dihydrodiol dehydrogenase [Oceanobacillus zhaokaii]AXI08285.1 dihydrodiol dehydrogenase [Oceanobacillus zhaokaii]QGS68207.1 dihydrodiol dehydrogenase [Oceanobacillus sp. 143]
MKKQLKSTNEIEIKNEFASVICKRVHTRNGMRLEISSPRLGFSIQLDALALESLTWQDMETFSKFLETPFGTEEDDV